MRDKRVHISGLTFYSGLDDLSKMAPDEKIDWLRRRLNKVVIRPLLEVKRIGRDNQAVWDLNLGVVTMICAAIEALGSFYQPNKKDEKAFREFVHEFMDAEYRKALSGSAKQKTYADVLYGQFRCGLAHGLTIEGHEVTTRPSRYLRDDSGYVSIDLWSLFEDMRRSIDKYLTRVHTHKTTQARFLQRFNRLFVEPYAQKHEPTGVGGASPKVNVTAITNRGSR